MNVVVIVCLPVGIAAEVTKKNNKLYKIYICIINYRLPIRVLFDYINTLVKYFTDVYNFFNMSILVCFP
jgi:hypothetical protein